MQSQPKLATSYSLDNLKNKNQGFGNLPEVWEKSDY